MGLIMPGRIKSLRKAGNTGLHQDVPGIERWV